MTAPGAPQLDTRRTTDFAAELHERARAWIPAWGLADAEGDFGRALLEIAARFSSEVAERLDGAGDKMRRGFLDWLAVRGEAARPARMPVVFKLADAARVAVLAEAPVRLQVDAAGTPVVLETEKDVRVVPGHLETIVGVDANEDAFYLAPSGLSDLQPLEAAPTRWQPKSFASAGSTKLQLDPVGGLAEATIIEAGGEQYRVVKVDKDLVTIEPPLAGELSPVNIVAKVDTFKPFGGTARNWQAHALYFGDSNLLNIEAAATIEIIGATTLREGVAWQYWGKGKNEEVGWQPFAFGSEEVQNKAKGIVLTKPKGAIEIYEIAGRSSRWIRAYSKKAESAVSSDEFTIRINADGCEDGSKCPPDPDMPSPVGEGMANTTPLVLENVFFPLGKEPRQFDAFYLGSKEVFSKPHAKVRLCFEMADPNFAALASLRTGSTGDQVLAGVAADGHLHLLRFEAATARLTRYGNRDPLRPPSPGAAGATGSSSPVPLDPRPAFRPAMWVVGSDFFVAVTAGNNVWMWREDTATPSQSGWTSLGGVQPNADPSIHTAGLAYLGDGAAGQLFALRDSTLYARDLNDLGGAWQFVSTKDGANVIHLQQIAPIAVETQNLAGDLSEGLVGVDTLGVVYAVEFPISPLAGTGTVLFYNAEIEVVPAAVRRADDSLIAVAVHEDSTDRKLLGFLSTPGTLTEAETDEARLDWPDTGGVPDVVGSSIDFNFRSSQMTFVVCVKDVAGATALASWAPLFSSSADTVAYIAKIPSSAGTAAGAPTLLPQHVLVPTSASEIIVATFDPSLRAPFSTTFETVVITEAAEDSLGTGDFVAYVFDNSGTDEYRLEAIPDAGVAYRGRVFHEFATPSVDEELLVYRASAPRFNSSVDTTDLTQLALDTGDTTTQIGSVLLIRSDKPPKLYFVDDIIAGVATLTEPLDVTDTSLPITYQNPGLSGAILRPLMKLDPNGNGNWDATLLERTRLQFPGADPEFQVGTAFKVDAGHPELVALSEAWTTAPPDLGSGAQFLVDGSVGSWSRQLGDSSTNPDLSWEYWNGTGWWTLGSVHDDTMNLKRTGALTFVVPSDLRESDWSGKTNHWIRARLIGGDYGQEKVTVTIIDKGSGKTEQTIQRSTDGIRAPSVLKLHISYALCDGVQPTFVLAEDSGSIRDQSDANRTPGAIVEAFVPLSVMLGRLSKFGAPPESPAVECPPECRCGSEYSSTNGRASIGTPTATETATAATSIPATGQFLLIGLDAALSEAPVNVLLLVQERDHTSLAPMTIEALIADRFQPIVGEDATRALGESGMLSMAFAIQPASRELFGRTLTWLRLSPAVRPTTTVWEPTLRGAYLNAVWASATETLTRELLGSSEGAPDLTVKVARPPVLHNTLELRLREPLGDEDREELREQDLRRVVSDVDGLSGDWVLWDRVVDPGDAPSKARVYSLDEAKGEIRFGDGLHGMIPPIGRDSIVAFSYKRTEPGVPGSESVPANTIAARTPLNLVSPVESVEAVVAADQAAGGAPAETDDRVLRFGFARVRHRGRVVTARDIEDLALQSSPDIVQAHAVAGRGSVRLVVVMKGRNPQPTAAQIRELRRLLLAAAPASLGAPNALRISGPAIRRLRVDLQLRTETLDNAGALMRDVKKRLASFFDTATGGTGRQGWPLGLNPSEEDIALALIDVPDLDGIASVSLREILDQGDERRWPSVVKPTEIVLLADDSVRIQFETAEEVS